jgi:hypothetical protein
MMKEESSLWKVEGSALSMKGSRLLQPLWWLHGALFVVIFCFEILITACYVSLTFYPGSWDYASETVGPLTLAGAWTVGIPIMVILCLFRCRLGKFMLSFYLV